MFALIRSALTQSRSPVFLRRRRRKPVVSPHPRFAIYPGPASRQSTICFTCGAPAGASAGIFARQACHTAPARVFGTDSLLRVSVGWHDAGDYGCYAVPACKAVADLLPVFRAAPEAFGGEGYP
ncbi:MAG TPA: glycoside hydrolase family 9 protein [Eubacteriales bacterium]|nr:glycoside hydrolase family 9 protein [Eubacteriales bacterium]